MAIDLDDIIFRMKKELGIKRTVGRRKQGEEITCECPRCGKAKLDINVHSGLYHCFVCGLDGKLKLSKKETEHIKKIRYNNEHKEVTDVPTDLYRVFVERGVNPEVTIARYKIGFDGSRLCWAVGDGYWRRAVFTGQEPKVLNDPESAGGLLGAHLLGSMDRVVVTEGDWKAASIPLPYIGVAIGGVGISSTQVSTLAYFKPKLVLIMLDGGKQREAKKIERVLASKMVNSVVVYGLPQGKGPDDVPIFTRMELIWQAERSRND